MLKEALLLGIGERHGQECWKLFLFQRHQEVYKLNSDEAWRNYRKIVSFNIKYREMNTLREVRQFLDSIPSINSGGCAIAALAMYRWLEKEEKLTKNTHIVYLVDNDYYEDNKRAIETNNESGTISSCCHAYLHHRGQLLDSTSNKPTQGFSRCIHQPFPSDNELIVKSINTPRWNWLFSRTNVKIIERKLNICLRDIDCLQ